MPCGVCGKTHEPRPCPLPAEPKPAPVVAVSAVSAEDAAEARRHERERVASLAYAWLLGKLDVDTRLQLHTVLRSASPEAPKGYAIEPAPVVAAEGLPTRFALPSDFVPKMRARIRDHDGACGCVECVAYCLGFADCEDEVESKSKTRRRKSTVEAIEAARREERERVLQELRGTLVQCCVDFAEDEAHAGGLAHAVRCLEDLIAAKKGQAK